MVSDYDTELQKKQGANLPLVLVKPHKNSTYNAT